MQPYIKLVFGMEPTQPCGDRLKPLQEEAIYGNLSQGKQNQGTVNDGFADVVLTGQNPENDRLERPNVAKASAVAILILG